MNASTIPEMIIAACVLLGLVWAILRFVFVPHFKELITETVEPWLKEVPNLTTAVRELTGRIELMENAIPSLASTAKAAAEVVATAAAAAKTAADAAATAAEAILKTARRRATAAQKRQVAMKR
jgi:uncharacterized phage infection (PIP) family protein YhgE